MKVGEARFTYRGLKNNLFTCNTVTWMKLSYDFTPWWLCGFKQQRVRVLPMVGEISTLPALLPPNFTTFTFTKRITSIRVFSLLFCSSLKRITSIQSLSLTLPSEDGESRQKPRGLKKGVPPFQHVCLFDFDFQYGHVVVWLMWLFIFESFHGGSTKTFGVSFVLVL